MIVERVGEDALRVRFDHASLEEASHAVRGLLHILSVEALPEIAETWRGARSVMIALRADPSTRLREIVHHASAPTHVAPTERTICLEVRYDGEDLADIAERCDMSVEAVIRSHASATYRLSFIGFAPGFPYLLGTPEALARIPRRDTPRARVPAGSLAIAGGWTGIYPNAGPGGWHLLGTVDATLFDASRTPPALLGDVTEIRFVPR